MKRFIYLILPFLILSCAEEKLIEQDFPLITTLEPTSVNSQGAMFHVEFNQLGSEPVSKVGFQWSLAGADEIAGEDSLVWSGEKGVFDKEINHDLINGLAYEIRAYAKYGDNTVFGNMTSFTSKGSEFAPWNYSKISGFRSVGYTVDYFAFSFGDFGILIGQDEKTYIFIDGYFGLIDDYSYSITTAKSAWGVNVGNSSYFFSDASVVLFEYNNGWSNETLLPFEVNSNLHFYLHAGSDYIDFLSGTNPYRYNITTKTWSSIRQFPSVNGSFIIDGVSIENKAYVIASDKSIWSYDSDSDLWESVTDFPGAMNASDRIVSFAYDDNLYFGFSFNSYNGTYASEIWSYNLADQSWNLEGRLPRTLRGANFYFVFRNKLYLFVDKIFDKAWVFDPSVKY